MSLAVNEEGWCLSDRWVRGQLHFYGLDVDGVHLRTVVLLCRLGEAGRLGLFSLRTIVHPLRQLYLLELGIQPSLRLLNAKIRSPNTLLHHSLLALREIPPFNLRQQSHRVQIGELPHAITLTHQ